MARHREPVLDKVLGHLPDELLSALALGLERHAGRLVAGRLYDGYDGGGCAVGVMLRELSPADYRQGRLQFRIRRHRHRSVLTERTGFDRSLVTRLSHVEMCFDRTTVSLSEHTGDPDLPAAANAAGRWMAEGCRQRLRARNPGFFVPLSWRPRRPTADPSPASTRRMIGHDGGVTSVALAVRDQEHEQPYQDDARRGQDDPGKQRPGKRGQPGATATRLLVRDVFDEARVLHLH